MSRTKDLLPIEAIITAYAMSRLDKEFLSRFSFTTWREAYKRVGNRLGVRPASMKNLRDEFDPIHPNNRTGWQRQLRRNRQSVVALFCDSRDEALIEVVRRILGGDSSIRSLVAEPILRARVRMENVAERLRTGRLAEEYFVQHSEILCGVPSDDLIDCRMQACGFDFGVANRSQLAIEVKGIKRSRGAILFTDHEWQQANRRQDEYWLVIVGCLDTKPSGKLIKNPAQNLSVSPSIRTITSVAWQSAVSMSCQFQ